MSLDAYISLPAHLLKQSPMMDGLGDVDQSSALPPLNNLPQWSRINTLDKARYPKPFRKDQLQPLRSVHTSSNSIDDDEVSPLNFCTSYLFHIVNIING